MHHKVVLITGCAKGIGRHLAEQFYKRNYYVVATDIDFEALQNAFEGWDTEGCLLEKLDVTHADDWQRVIYQTIAEFGQLDICINNAGVIAPNFVADMTTQEIDFQLNVNTKGVLYGSKFASELMMRQGFGHLINFSSLAGVAPIHGLAVYSASKHAVRAFTLSIVPELKAKGVFASVICPDLVNTDMLTLQLDYPAAALTFSGDKYLSVADIEKAVFERALMHHEVEILVPKGRGLLAKIGNFFPHIGFKMAHFLEKKGDKQREKMKLLRG